jgi:hypothetical protein
MSYGLHLVSWSYCKLDPEGESRPEAGRSALENETLESAA